MLFPKGKLSRNQSSLSVSSAATALVGHYSQRFYLILFVMVNCDKNKPKLPPFFFNFQWLLTMVHPTPSPSHDLFSAW